MTPFIRGDNIVKRSISSQNLPYIQFQLTISYHRPHLLRSPHTSTIHTAEANHNKHTTDDDDFDFGASQRESYTAPMSNTLYHPSTALVSPHTDEPPLSCATLYCIDHDPRAVINTPPRRPAAAPMSRVRGHSGEWCDQGIRATLRLVYRRDNLAHEWKYSVLLPLETCQLWKWF